MPALPNNIDAEKVVLGSILIDPDAIGAVRSLLHPGNLEDNDNLQGSAFYHGAHRRIYLAMCDLHEAGDPIDMMTVYALVKQVDALDDIGGLDYLKTLEECVMSTANVAHHALIVQESAQRRNLMARLSEAINGARAGEDATDLAAQLIEIVDTAPDTTPRLGSMGLIDFLDAEDSFPEVSDLWAGRVLAKNEIALISGPPKIAKSFFAQQLSLCLATGTPFLGLDTAPACVFYLQVEIADRMLVGRFRQQVDQFEVGMNGVHDTLNQNLHVSTFARGFHLFSDADGSEAGANLARLRRILDVVQPDFVILDPLSQIFRCEENDNRASAEALAIVDRLIARYGCGVLLVHHWSKIEIAAMGTRAGPSLMTATRGAGKWVDYASSVVTLHYPDLKHQELALIDFTFLRNRPDLDAIYVKRPCASSLFFERTDPPPENERKERSKGDLRSKKGFADMLNILAFGSTAPAVLTRKIIEQAHCSPRQAAEVIALAFAAGIIAKDLAGEYVSNE